jgi:hypothetical protein
MSKAERQSKPSKRDGAAIARTQARKAKHVAENEARHQANLARKATAGTITVSFTTVATDE